MNCIVYGKSNVLSRDEDTGVQKRKRLIFLGRGSISMKYTENRSVAFEV